MRIRLMATRNPAWKSVEVSSLSHLSGGCPKRKLIFQPWFSGSYFGFRKGKQYGYLRFFWHSWLEHGPLKGVYFSLKPGIFLLTPWVTGVELLTLVMVLQPDTLRKGVVAEIEALFEGFSNDFCPTCAVRWQMLANVWLSDVFLLWGIHHTNENKHGEVF